MQASKQKTKKVHFADPEQSGGVSSETIDLDDFERLPNQAISLTKEMNEAEQMRQLGFVMQFFQLSGSFEAIVFYIRILMKDERNPEALLIVSAINWLLLLGFIIAMYREKIDRDLAQSILMIWLQISRLMIIGVNIPYFYEKNTDMDFILNVMLQMCGSLFTFLVAVYLVKGWAERSFLFLLYFSALTVILT